MPKTQRSRPVAPPAFDRLAAWAERKPRIALMGEFSSGKSTLLNLLIGEELLPTRVTATELPPVWFSYGEPGAHWVDRQGRPHPLDFGDFGGVPRSARYIRVFAPAPILERCDVIDTPGISDPNLDEESWRFPVGQASFVLWCTPCTQAWRETERSTWLSLPARLRAQSLLVVTRADKLGMLDRDKVARRLGRESAGMFDGMVFLASPDALRGRALMARSGDAALWEASGGAELEARIDLGIAAVRAARTKLLRRYHTGDPPELEPPLDASDGDLRPEPTTLRLVLPPEPVRPRRVERPESRRTERPLMEGAADPLDEIRAGWKALRSSEPEPAPVLRLTDPVARAEPLGTALRDEGRAALDRPLVAEPTAQERAPVESRSAPAEEPAPQSAPEAVPDDQAPVEEPVVAALPRAVRIWRDIVASHPEMPSNVPIVAMIDQLLCELSRDDKPLDETGLTSAGTAQRNRAA